MLSHFEYHFVCACQDREWAVPHGAKDAERNQALRGDHL